MFRNKRFFLYLSKAEAMKKTKREKSFDYELPDDIDNYRELIKHIKEKSEREM